MPSTHVLSCINSHGVCRDTYDLVQILIRIRTRCTAWRGRWVVHTTSARGPRARRPRGRRRLGHSDGVCSLKCWRRDTRWDGESL